MEQDAYRPVKLAAKPGAAASMTDAKRDDLEHQIKCQCGCPLDVYTCRTTYCKHYLYRKSYNSGKRCEW